jgi:hypothetical protein
MYVLKRCIVKLCLLKRQLTDIKNDDFYFDIISELQSGYLLSLFKPLQKKLFCIVLIS